MPPSEPKPISHWSDDELDEAARGRPTGPTMPLDLVKRFPDHANALMDAGHIDIAAQLARSSQEHHEQDNAKRVAEGKEPLRPPVGGFGLVEMPEGGWSNEGDPEWKAGQASWTLHRKAKQESPQAQSSRTMPSSRSRGEAAAGAPGGRQFFVPAPNPTAPPGK